MLGTDFHQINLISKNSTICFVNPPYSEFSQWISNIINHLNFGLLYAIIPIRWEDDLAIKEAMQLRGLKYSKILAEDDFLDADRAARAKVHIIRFSFDDVDGSENIKNPISGRTGRSYRQTIGRSSTDPFQLFLENELGLKKTYSTTTEKFNEYVEQERVRKEMNTEGTSCYELVESEGILWALLNNYERDLSKTLEQYKLISGIDDNLLQELGVNYEALRTGAKEKLLGFRNVYWSLLFEKLDTISSRLTSKNKKSLLTKLSSNALDFTYSNALYIIGYAVELGNEYIEQSLTDVFKQLTSPDSISRYYVSNKHIFSDDWRYTQNDKISSKYLLDYRFIHSSWSNFSTRSWESGLCEGARDFTNDFLVIFKLLGYNSLYQTCSYDLVSPGGKISIMGNNPDGDQIELVRIKYYKNGNRHIFMDQGAMLRFNVTVSRILGWVRSKDDFATESNNTETIDESIWDLSNQMKVTANNILMLTDNAA